MPLRPISLSLLLLSIAITNPSLAQPKPPVKSSSPPNRSIEILRLEQTLKAQNFALADRLTRDYLSKRTQDLIQPIHENVQDNIDAMKRIPCPELMRIDRAWQGASQTKFGLQVQARIWTEFSRQPKKPTFDPVLQLAHRVGWLPKLDKDWTTTYLIPQELNYSRSAPTGHLPAIGVWDAGRWPAEVYGTAFLDSASVEKIYIQVETLLGRVSTCVDSRS
jgi:hypothetical protein